jgi:hypothetical protein
MSAASIYVSAICTKINQIKIIRKLTFLEIQNFIEKFVDSHLHQYRIIGYEQVAALSKLNLVMQ